MVVGWFLRILMPTTTVIFNETEDMGYANSFRIDPTFPEPDVVLPEVPEAPNASRKLAPCAACCAPAALLL